MFIVFEGSDGSGKTTQARLLADYLRNEGFNVVLTHEPGGTELAETLRDIVLEDEYDELTQFYLFQAARFDHYKKVITPALIEKKIVICDRFFDSTSVYQAKVPKDFHVLSKTAISKYPDITFVLDIPPSLSYERIRERNELNVFDEKQYEYHAGIRDRFLHIAHEDKTQFHQVIDGYGKREEVFARIKENFYFNLSLDSYKNYIENSPLG